MGWARITGLNGMASLRRKFRKSVAERGLAATFVYAATHLLYRAGIVKSPEKDRARLRKSLVEYRKYLSSVLFDQLGGVVRYGPLKGFKLQSDPGWGGTDKASMLLGLYEKEVLDALASVPPEKRILVNLGGGDGYYGVGLVKCGLFDRSICFELSERNRAVIEKVASENGLSGQVRVLGAADERFHTQLADLNVDPKTCVVICDIEGAEFAVLNQESLKALKDATLIVEIHDFLVEDGAARYRALKDTASSWFQFTEFTTGARNPADIPELHAMNDTDRWLICSEGRDRLMSWLRLDPK